MRQFKTKVSVSFGERAIEKIRTLEYKRFLLVVDPFMLKSGMADEVIKIFKSMNVEYFIYSDVVPNVPLESVVEGIKLQKVFCPDAIIALGGGSCIDTAKSMIYFSYKSGSQRPFFIAIPTTSGTGSEATSFTVLKVKDRKIPIVDDMMIPDLAILDTDFVKTVPNFITADTGIDALVHALEAYLSREASVCTDALAEKAIEVIFEKLPIAYINGEDLDAREKLHNASYMAGMAFNNAQLGINHSIAHAIGAKFNIPHGKANALCIAAVIDYNSKNSKLAQEKYSRLARILGLPAENTKQGASSFICAIEVLLKEVGINVGLENLGIDKSVYKSKIDEMTEEILKDICTTTNPVHPTVDDIKNILEKIY